MYYIIVNPASKSGQGAKIWEKIRPILEQRKITYKVLFSQEAGHVIRLTADLSASLLNTNSDFILKLIVLGGDGTLNEALQGISDFARVQIGYIPTGSSNDMARDLKLSPNPSEVLENILSCEKPLLMDLGCLTYEQVSSQLSRQHSNDLMLTRFFSVSSGIGFDAAVCEEALASKFKNVLNKIGLGKLTYLIIALKQLIQAKKVTCTITLDDEQQIYLPKFLFVACMIHQYEGGGFKFCPGADPCDGLIDVCAVGNIPKWLILLALPTAFEGKHYRFNGIDHYAAHKIHLETSMPLWVHTDGEVTMKCNSITLTCEQKKLQFLL
ncbi:MAG: diacylglycerol kinase family lipid kinase [Lachnospiraceae bacterium]|nr:diacylglycerol kinase family lipid kinase [Lachnospiraceae bacterium]